MESFRLWALGFGFRVELQTSNSKLQTRSLPFPSVTASLCLRVKRFRFAPPSPPLPLSPVLSPAIGGIEGPILPYCSFPHAPMLPSPHAASPCHRVTVSGCFHPVSALRPAFPLDIGHWTLDCSSPSDDPSALGKVTVTTVPFPRVDSIRKSAPCS